MLDQREPSPSALLASLRRGRSDLHAMVLDPALHPQGLNRLTAHALERGWPHAAFAFADRRCRIPPVPNARDHLLRAEASRRLGDLAGAAADTRAARTIDPLDPLVSLQALRCLDGDERTEASRMLVASSRAVPAQVSAALAHLESVGTRVNARLDASPEELSGWVTWPQGETLICEVAGAHRIEAVVHPDAGHPLASPSRSAAAVTMPRPPGARSQVRFVCRSGEATWEARFEPGVLQRVPTRSWQPATEPQPRLLVVVPVFGDYDATVACLDSLRTQTLPGGAITTVVVDDASPDPRIVADLDARAGRGDFTLIRNPQNLGFAAAVNAAVASGSEGEILLLNADTVLPPRALERLLELLRSDASIGTVTPLSNNGELTSFPLPYTFNPLPGPGELLDWDAAAAKTAASPVDLPNGIGFCMLVRRCCWEQLGGIAQIYGRGYYEDVDLCLRARDLGFRNVCATNLVVGHAGSRSFGGMKRALVVRNLETITTRFPDFERESAAFLRAHPLRAAFADIERHISPPAHDLLLVTALGAEHPTVRTRIGVAAGAAHRALLLSVGAYRRHAAAALTSTLGLVPQSLRFDFADPDDLQALCTYLRKASIDRIEFLDVDRCPRSLFEALLQFGRPVDVLIGERRALIDPDDADAYRDTVITPSRAMAESAAGLQPWWAAHLGPGDRVLCSDVMALAAVHRTFGTARKAFRIDPEPRCRAASLLHMPPRRTAPFRSLGVLAPIATGTASAFVQALRASLARSCPEVQLVVLGATMNDLALIANGGVFVTGPIGDEGIGRLIEFYGCQAIVSPYRDSLYHWIEAAGACSPAALGYFDWSGGGHLRRAGDLVLDPALTDAEAVERVVDWFATLPVLQSKAPIAHHG